VALAAEIEQWRIVADSGEGYSSLQAARDCAQRVKDNGGGADID
jgi:uncharacterized protein YegP (UPF0339 family)